VRHRDVMAIHRVMVWLRLPARIEVRDQLVAEEIEVDPLGRAATLGAAQLPAVELARRGQVMYGNGKMERLHRHDGRYRISDRRGYGWPARQRGLCVGPR
jgi:hypothetical protein